MNEEEEENHHQKHRSALRALKNENSLFLKKSFNILALKVQNIKVRIVLLVKPAFGLQFKEKQGVSYLKIFPSM